MKLSYGFALSIIIIIGGGLAALAKVLEDVYLLGSVLDDFAGGILVAGTLGLIDKYLLHNQLVNLIISKVNLKKSIDETGIAEVKLGWRDLPYGKLFTKCRDNIDVVHAYANTWTNFYADDFVEILRSKKVEIRIVLLDLDDEAIINAFAKQYNRTPSELKSQIKSALRKWKDIYDRSGIDDKGRLKVYLQNGIQTMSLYRFDKTMICSTLTITKKPRGSYQLPSIVCSDNGKISNLYNIYLQEIEGVINEAREFDLDTL